MCVREERSKDVRERKLHVNFAWFCTSKSNECTSARVYPFFPNDHIVGHFSVHFSIAITKVYVMCEVAPSSNRFVAFFSSFDFYRGHFFMSIHELAHTFLHVSVAFSHSQIDTDTYIHLIANGFVHIGSFDLGFHAAFSIRWLFFLSSLAYSVA